MTNIKTTLSPKQTAALLGSAAAAILVVAGAFMLAKGMKDLGEALDNIELPKAL